MADGQGSDVGEGGRRDVLGRDKALGWGGREPRFRGGWSLTAAGSQGVPPHPRRERPTQLSSRRPARGLRTENKSCLKLLRLQTFVTTARGNLHRETGLRSSLPHPGPAWGGRLSPRRCGRPPPGPPSGGACGQRERPGSVLQGSLCDLQEGFGAGGACVLGNSPPPAPDKSSPFPSSSS